MSDFLQPTPELVKSETEQTQLDTRAQRVERLRVMVEELFPGEGKRELRENIERSFLVPQIGEYHNEGMFMDSHLDLIIENLDRVKMGEFPEDMSLSTRAALTRAVERYADSVRQYAFLHDISKADCLTIKFGEEARVMTWSEWQTLLASSESGRKAQTGDEEALRQFSQEQGITGVSYFQGGDDSKRQHGKVGADELRTTGGTDNDAMLAAIEAHEVAYSFQHIKVDTYEKHFSDMMPEVRDFALLASFVDTMASLRKDGKPDLSNFLALAGSREKHEALEVLAKKLEGMKFDKQKFQRAWSALRGSSDPLTMEMIEMVGEKLSKECRLAGYDVARLRDLTETLITDGTLTSQEREQLLALAENEPQGIGRIFGSKMRFLTPILKQAQL